MAHAIFFLQDFLVEEIAEQTSSKPVHEETAEKLSTEDVADGITDTETSSESSEFSELEELIEDEETIRRNKLICTILNEGEVDAKEFYTEAMGKLLKDLKGAFTDKDIVKFHRNLTEKVIDAFRESLKDVEETGSEHIRSILIAKELEISAALEVLLHTFLKRHELHVNQTAEHLKILAFATEAKYDEAMEIFNEMQCNTEEEIRDFHYLCTSKLAKWFEEMLEEYGLCPDEPAFKLEITELFSQKLAELPTYINNAEPNDDSHEIKVEEIDLDTDEKIPNASRATLKDDKREKFCFIL